MKNISRILNKANPTGKEVGQIMLYNMAASYSELSASYDDTYKTKYEVIAYSDLVRMKSTLKSSYDIESFNEYSKICSYISKEQGFAASALQTAKLGLWKIQELVKAAFTAEQNITELAKMPVVMTEQQYKEYEKIILGEKRRKMATLSDIILSAFITVRNSFRDGQTDTQIIQSFTREFFKVLDNKRIEEIGKPNYRGVYRLSDGSSSADYSQEEWSAAVDLIIYGDESHYSSKWEKIANRATQPNYFTNLELTQFEIQSIIDALYNREKPFVDISFMSDVVIWEPIAEEKGALGGNIVLYSLETYYPALFSKEDASKEEVEQQAAELWHDFPETASLILTIIKMAIPEAEEAIKNEAWQQPILSIGTLADKGIFSFKDSLTVSSNEIAPLIKDEALGRLCLWNGIAILREEDKGLINIQGKHNVDERGFFVNSNAISRIEVNDIYSLYYDAKTIEMIEIAREAELKPSLRELYAYNKILELISELTEVDVMPFALTRQVEELHEQIEALNGLITMLYHSVSSSIPLYLPKAKEEYKPRKEACMKLFPRLNLEELALEEAAIDKTRAYIQNAAVFSYNSPLIIETLKERGAANE